MVQFFHIVLTHLFVNATAISTTYTVHYAKIVSKLLKLSCCYKKPTHLITLHVSLENGL